MKKLAILLLLKRHFNFLPQRTRREKEEENVKHAKTTRKNAKIFYFRVYRGCVFKNKCGVVTKKILNLTNWVLHFLENCFIILPFAGQYGHRKFDRGLVDRD
jgi:hypothetical protein